MKKLYCDCVVKVLWWKKKLCNSIPSELLTCVTIWEANDCAIYKELFVYDQSDKKKRSIQADRVEWKKKHWQSMQLYMPNCRNRISSKTFQSDKDLDIDVLIWMISSIAAYYCRHIVRIWMSIGVAYPNKRIIYRVAISSASLIFNLKSVFYLHKNEDNQHLAVFLSS